jgi:LDH2 family malate/lactate/ureidoglycolate dehydrogenase
MSGEADTMAETTGTDGGMRVFPAERLERLANALLVAAGTSPEAAAQVASSLVWANLAGHDSHGVLRLPAYLEGVRLGHVVPTASPSLLRRRGATAVIDAADGWGQAAMWLATNEAIALAREFGIGAAAVRRSYHIGRVAPYVESIAAQGMIGLAMANAAPAVAPFGGRGRVLGTNPIAWAAPRGDGKPPVCLDVATAAIAEGKLRVARAKGASVPAGNVVDGEGRPATDPNAFYAGGALLAFGGHKGSGFGLLAQIVGRGLAGMDPSAYDGPRGVNGPFVLAIDVAPFSDPAEFLRQVDLQCDAVTGCPPGADCEEVLLPGEPELRTRARREVEGIPVAASTWRDLLTEAERWGVEA